MDIAQSFRDYFKQHDIYYEETITEENIPIFRMNQTIEGGNPLIITITFNQSFSTCDGNIFNIAHIENPLKREDLLKLINELNMEYRFPKFMVDEKGNVFVQYSITILDGVNPEAVLLPLFFAVESIEKEEYSKFMKLRWL